MKDYDIQINLKVHAASEASAEQKVFDFFKGAIHVGDFERYDILEWDWFEFPTIEEVIINEGIST